MTTLYSRCFRVAHFIKPPIKYTFSESLIIYCRFRSLLDLRQEIKPFPKIAIVSQKYIVSQIEFVASQNLMGESEGHCYVFFTP